MLGMLWAWLSRNCPVEAYTGGVSVHVYEPEASVLSLAERYQDFSMCEGHNLYIHYDPDLNMLMKKLTDYRVIFAIHYPSLRNIRNAAQKEAMEKFFVTDSSRRKQAKYLYANFISNSKLDVRQARHLIKILNC